MKHWIFTALGDRGGLEQRLNVLAGRGLELQSIGDGLSVLGEFQPTNRSELSYCVETPPLLRTNDQIRHSMEEHAARGWRPVGTINGMDVYCAAPLRFPKRVESPQRRWPELFSLLGVAMSCCLCLFLPGGRWYLSNAEIVLHLSAFLFLPVGMIWSAWRLYRFVRLPGEEPLETLVLLRGVVSCLWFLWWIVLAVSVILTLLPLRWGLLILLLGLILFLCSGVSVEEGKLVRIQRGRLIWCGVCLGGMLLLAIGLNWLGISSEVREFHSGPTAWEADRFVHLADVMSPSEELLFSEYRRQESLLVRWESCSESSEGQHLECQVYTCPVPAVCRLLSGQWVTGLAPEGENRSAWVAEGKRMMIVTCSQAWEKDPRRQMKSLLSG